jgi:UDP-N-acetylmuramate: L-alanyl-gamma-D-glutamyl-meso-diaminopimelate ligase
MLTTTPRKIFLSGICGTAMASLAGMLRATGYEVTGSDANVYPPMSTFLESLGIRVSQGFDAAHIREAAPDLVVIGNALSRGNPEVEYVLDSGIRYVSAAETLKELFIRGHRTTVVTGTHGKTTTTALLAWILECAGRSPSFMVGGIAENFGSSFQVGSGADFVIEGDEYDTAFFDKGPKFLHYLPHIVLVNNIEFDHADIYRDLDAITLAFRRLMRLVPSSGLVVAGIESAAVAGVVEETWCEVATFGLRMGQWRAGEILPAGEGVVFDVFREGALWHRFESPLVGGFNVLNALGAIIAANRLGLSAPEIATGLASFRNVRRRLEIRGEVGGITVYDDFAHHPTAVRETLRGVRERFPDSRIWAIFEPRSQTARRSLFAEEFAGALAQADIAVIAPVFAPGRLGGKSPLSPSQVAEQVRQKGRKAHAPETTGAILELLLKEATQGDRIVIMSNGGFDNLHQRLIDGLRKR